MCVWHLFGGEERLQVHSSKTTIFLHIVCIELVCWVILNWVYEQLNIARRVDIELERWNVSSTVSNSDSLHSLFFPSYYIHQVWPWRFLSETILTRHTITYRCPVIILSDIFAVNRIGVVSTSALAGGESSRHLCNKGDLNTACLVR